MFDLTIAKSELLPRLLTVAGAIDKRQVIAILSNILMRIEGQQLTLLATDTEIEIAACISCNNTDSQGQVTVPARKFIDIIRSLEEDTLARLRYQENSMQIKAGHSQFKLATLPAEQFPISTLEAPSNEFTLLASELLHLFQSTHFAMSSQDVRIFLNGLYLEFDQSLITAVATDGHRMAICKLTSVKNLAHTRLLLPRKSVQEIMRLLSGLADEQITLLAGKGYFRLTSNEYTFTSKLIETRFPPYIKAIPKANDKFILIDKERLKRALARIVILAHEKSRAVLMHLKDNHLTLVANNQEHEEAVESLEAQIKGSELKIGINAHYLMDVLNFLPHPTVKLSMSTTEQSILVEAVEKIEKNDYQYIIMPMKL